MDITVDNVDAVGAKRNRPGGFRYWLPAIVLMITVILAFLTKLVSLSFSQTLLFYLTLGLQAIKPNWAG